MKRFTCLVLFTLLILTISCNKEDSTCITEKIETFKDTKFCDKGATVKEYSFDGQLVYVFHDGNCGADMASIVLDNNCNQIGFLGGLIGETKINNIDFFANAKLKRTLYSD